MSSTGRRAGRRLWIGIPGPEIDAATRSLLEEVRPGGVILFRRNVVSATQVRDLVTGLKELLGPGVVISVDQEGGLVVRFREQATVFPGNMALGAIAASDRELGLRLAERQGVLSARELRGLGIDVNFAPDLDLAVRGDNPAVLIRGFAEDPDLVGALGAALVRGTFAGGVTPTIKHFPGLGGATVDPHFDMPRIADNDAALHLRAYEAPRQEGPVVVMTTHAICPDLDPDQPVTLSRRIVSDLLRPMIHEDAVIMCDDLEMGAMTRLYGFDDVVRGTAAAGHDVLCICHSGERVREAHRLLQAALERGEDWYGDADAIERRLDALRCHAGPGEPAESAPGEALSREIAERAITVVADDGALLPLSSDARPLIALPAVEAGTPVEDPLRGEEDGQELQRALGKGATLYGLPLEPSPDEVEELLAAAADYTHLIVVLTNARFLAAQAHLARAAVQGHPATILVAIRSPFDFEVLDEGTRFSGLASYGFRDQQLRALAAVIDGRAEAGGCLPVTLRWRTPTS